MTGYRATHHRNPDRPDQPLCSTYTLNPTFADELDEVTCVRCNRILHARPDLVKGLLMSVIDWHGGYIYTDQLHAAIDRYLEAIND